MVVIYDFFSKKEIIPPDYIIFLPDDTLKILKEKIFASYNIKFINIKTMAIGDGSKYLTSDNTLQTVYVYNLIDEINDYIINNMNIYLNIDKASIINSKHFISLFNKLKEIYTDLTTDDLILTIKMILIKNFNFMFTDTQDSILNWKSITNQHKKKLIEKYKLLAITNITKKEQNVISNYIPTINNEYDYSIVSAIISFKIYDKPLDIYNIIKEFPVDKYIPFLYTFENNMNKPIVRFLKSFPKKIISEWFIKSKNNNDLLLKTPKGLTFKLLNKYGGYSSAILSKYTPKLTIRCSWTKELKTKFSDISLCTSNLQYFINRINKIFNTDKITIDNPNITYVNIHFITKKYVTFSKLKIAIKFFSDILSEDTSEKQKKIFKIKYIPDDITIIIRYNEEISNELVIKTNSVDIIGIKNKQQINTIIKLIGKLFISADLQTPLFIKNNVFVPEIDINNIKKISKQNVKILKQKGIDISAVSCQKKRQPIISDESPPNNSYSINYNNNTFICNNPPYIYPGFTSKKSVCCFKKDQRKKQIYINTLKKSSPYIKLDDDETLLKSNIIKSDKVLQPYRLGILSEILYNVFDNSFLRLGFNSNNLTLLNILNFSNSKNITLDTIISSINSSIFSSLNNGEIKKSFTKDEYISYISNNNLEHEYISDLLSIIFKTNIIIFDISSIDNNHIICNELTYFPYSKYVFILKNKDNYELIVQKTSSVSLKKIFSKKDDIVSNILHLYKQSCIIKYTGYPITPMNFVELMDSNIKISGQVINSFNNIIYVNTQFGIFPVIPTKLILNVKKVKISDITRDARIQYNLLLNSNIDYVLPIGQITNKLQYTIGLVLKCGLIIPTKISKNILDLPIIYRQFSDNIDYLLSNEVPSLDKRYSYMLYVNFYKELYQRFRFTLSNIIHNNKAIYDNILSILNSKESNILNSIKNIIKYILKDEIILTDKLSPSNIPSIRNVCSSLEICSLDPFCKNIDGSCKLAIDSEFYPNFIKKLALDIISDRNIILGKVKSEFISKNNFIMRKNEIVLLSNEDIINFLD